ncbi:hypothetical protein KIPB_006991, partial [Kipferlia bialata]
VGILYDSVSFDKKYVDTITEALHSHNIRPVPCFVSSSSVRSADEVAETAAFLRTHSVSSIVAVGGPPVWAMGQLLRAFMGYEMQSAGEALELEHAEDRPTRRQIGLSIITSHQFTAPAFLTQTLLKADGKYVLCDSDLLVPDIVVLDRQFGEHFTAANLYASALSTICLSLLPPINHSLFVRAPCEGAITAAYEGLADVTVGAHQDMIIHSGGLVGLAAAIREPGTVSAAAGVQLAALMLQDATGCSYSGAVLMLALAKAPDVSLDALHTAYPYVPAKPRSPTLEKAKALSLMDGVCRAVGKLEINGDEVSRMLQMLVGTQTVRDGLALAREE